MRVLYKLFTSKGRWKKQGMEWEQEWKNGNRSNAILSRGCQLSLDWIPHKSTYSVLNKIWFSLLLCWSCPLSLFIWFIFLYCLFLWLKLIAIAEYAYPLLIWRRCLDHATRSNFIGWFSMFSISPAQKTSLVVHFSDYWQSPLRIVLLLFPFYPIFRSLLFQLCHLKREG